MKKISNHCSMRYSCYIHAFCMGRDDMKSLRSNYLCSEFFFTELDSDPTVLDGPVTISICQELVPSNCQGLISAGYRCGGNGGT